MTADSRKTFQEEDRKHATRWAGMVAILLALAVVIATAAMVLTIQGPKVTAEPSEAIPETPKVTYIPARPSVEPTGDPIINSMKLYAFGSEITSDGFTAYVGDKAITLSVELEPRYTHPPVNWSVSNSDAARLSVSDDRLSCEFTVLKSAGKTELTISCYGMELVFPVYLWKR